MAESSEIAPVDKRCPGCDRWACDGCDGDLQQDEQRARVWSPGDPPILPPAEVDPYRHDHSPLNEDLHGGICSACEWERDMEVEVTENAIRVLRNSLATVGDLLSSSDLAELRAGLVEMTRWVQRNDPVNYPEAADRFHHCTNSHEWWGPAFPTCPICHANRRES